MAELRYNPFLDDYVIVASHRQNRPQMPQDYCPFCPGSGRVPETYTVLAYGNDFPALSLTPPPEPPVGNAFFQTRPAYGKCEVILYTSEHQGSLSSLSGIQAGELVELWVERFLALSADPKLKYILIFENRGEAVGVTIPHPHGQIYGYSYLPKKIALECASIERYNREKGRCLYCELLENELVDGRRVLFRNRFFTVFVPFFAAYPYEVFVLPTAHRRTIAELTPEERSALAETLCQVCGMYDHLFGFSFPYMMCVESAPVNTGAEYDYHFHVEFFPPMRSADKFKMNASSETGVLAHCNPTAPEEKAEELRAAYQRYIESI